MEDERIFDLKRLTNSRLMDQMINFVKPANGWKILVLDELSTKVMSSVCRMSDLTSSGVTVVENLALKRQPLPTFEAIYLIYPSEESIQKIISDYEDGRVLYQAVHLFTLTPCPDHLFSQLAQSSVSKYMKNFIELNVNYLAIESQAFTLNDPLGIWINYSPKAEPTHRYQSLNYASDQLSTLFASIGENPYVSYLKTSSLNKEYAQAISSRLDGLAALEQIPRKKSAKLVIVDRSMDLVSPFVHELTYQAMLYDVHNIINDKITVEGEDFLLDENDELWSRLRHMHVVDFSRLIADIANKFKEKDLKTRPTQGKATAEQLADIMRKMPKLKEEGKKTSFHFENATFLMNKVEKDDWYNLCEAEQDTLFQEDGNGNPVKNVLLEKILPMVVNNKSVDYEQKLRLLMLYILRNDIEDRNKRELFDRANVLPADKEIFENLKYIDSRNFPDGEELPRLRRNMQGLYATSRWTPVLKDICEIVLAGRENDMLLKYLGEKPPVTAKKSAAPQSRRTKKNWTEKKGENAEKENAQKIIIFVVGSMTYSEMRCAYELSNANHQIIIGSHTVFSPDDFLGEVRDLSVQLNQ